MARNRFIGRDKKPFYRTWQDFRITRTLALTVGRLSWTALKITWH